MLCHTELVTCGSVACSVEIGHWPGARSLRLHKLHNRVLSMCAAPVLVVKEAVFSHFLAAGVDTTAEQPPDRTITRRMGQLDQRECPFYTDLLLHALHTMHAIQCLSTLCMSCMLVPSASPACRPAYKPIPLQTT